MDEDISYRGYALSPPLLRRGFSMAQSSALTIIVGAGYGFYTDLRARIRASDAFSPFWVSVSANWYKLLQDHKIVRTEPEAFCEDVNSAWRELSEKNNSEDSANTYRVLRSDIAFTV